MSNEKIIIIAAVAGSVSLFLLILLTVLEKTIDRKRSEKYIVLFIKYYIPDGNIRYTWQQMEMEYKKKSIESKTIRRALYYMDHSIMKDYQTAMQKIEIVFKGKTIHTLHQYCLEHCKKTLALPVK